MPKFNDLNLTDWRELSINTDSLWLINERDKTGKHRNLYHGNFVPQIPRQLIQRYTKQDEVVFEPFMGSGTTLFECESLRRKYIGVDINPAMIDYVSINSDQLFGSGRYSIKFGNSGNQEELRTILNESLQSLEEKSVQFLLMHPPYMDIVKFTENENDLSQFSDLKTFLQRFRNICENSLAFLDKNRYFAVVIGDVYRNSEVVPLGFYCMDMIKRNFRTKLKGIIVKNIEGNRGKIGQNSIWKIRALRSDYFIFKHEYIFVFKKEF
jgi:hypothetical protein